MLSVRATTPIQPSEDPAKVEKAMRTLFPDAVLSRARDRLAAETDSLKGFRELVWKQRILDATRRVLLGGLSPDGRRGRLELSKQAAYVGAVSFAVGQAPLGDIVVDVEGDGLEAVFKELAPPTLHGRPVTEEQYARHLEKRQKIRAQRRHLAVAASEGEE